MVTAQAESRTKTRVLIVEDDPNVSEVVVRYLERDGFDVRLIADGRKAVAEALHDLPDIVVLDIMLPGLDGLEVCRRLRAKAPIPIIMLTALGEESDRVLGLELGADDYLAKPFSPRELVARVRSVLRRAKGPLAEGSPELARSLTFGNLHLDLGSRQVSVRAEEVSLTAREFELLAFLALHPRRVFGRDELLENVWGYSFGDRSTVTVHIRRLREKIEADPTDPRWVQTVWGVGYRFDP
jgi:DNA-binding response OmpR family regulator